MATKIEWAAESWNPVTGCTPISEGCANCYARRMAHRLAGRFGYPSKSPFSVTTHPERLDVPLHWRKPRRIFVCSMGDLFHPQVPDSFRAAVFERMHDNERHTFMVLTKREMEMVCWIERTQPLGCAENVWLGVSVENEKQAQLRLPDLLSIPASIRFVSCEPLLGPIDLARWIYGIGWLIIGCESGPKRRRCKLNWVRALVSWARAARVPVFVKQLAIDGRVEHDPQKWPADLRLREFPTPKS